MNYNMGTGQVELQDPIKNQHWGDTQSTFAKYGVDVRAEVVLLSRNIKIYGNDEDTWGCTILTGEYKQSRKNVFTGQLIMDNVEIYNCSQQDKQRAALRFEYSTKGFEKVSVVQNSVIHNGLSWGLSADSFSGLTVENTAVIGFR